MTPKLPTMGLEELRRSTWAYWTEFEFQLQIEIKDIPLLFCTVMFIQSSQEEFLVTLVKK